MKIWKEFKEFAFRGNVIDLAVGVMIGGAFTSIVNSLVNDLFTPLLSIVTGKIDFSTLSFTIGSGENAPVVAYGSFMQTVINFLLVAACIFLFIKGVNKLKRPRPGGRGGQAAGTTVPVLLWRDSQRRYPLPALYQPAFGVGGEG